MESIFCLIEKEEIGSLHFPKDEVLFDKDELKTREKSIKSALSLGNLMHHKVRIYFHDIEGPKQVETTIWGVTDSAILLKSHIAIPINRIVNIKI